MDYKELQEFIKSVVKSGITEVEIKTKDIKIVVKAPPKRKGSQPETIVQQIPVQMPAMQQNPMAVQQVAAPAAPPVAVEVPAETKKEDDSSKYITIKAPMVGTFYRKPAPEKPSFVNVGDAIEEGKVICIIEAMKLFNEIEAEVSGKIVKVLVDDNMPVEYDQDLFLVEPS